MTHLSLNLNLARKEHQQIEILQKNDTSVTKYELRCF